ncbi:MAG TPA: hypothetical protein VGT79_10080 [Xanthomonadaceae bacterium]|nr:hypothetical protein [Xanthomonadaceae bacterium]
MKSIIACSFCAALLSSSSISFAATSLPAEGTYGFDWLKNPNSTRCIAVSKALIKKFRKCEISDGSFGGDPVQARKCTLDKHSEYMVYETREACVKSLETEKANE